MFACQLSNHLVGLGHEIQMVTVYGGNADLPYKQEILCLNAKPSRKFIHIPAWKKLNTIIREFEPDIIQANSGDTLKYAVLSKLTFKWSAPIVSRNASEVGRYLNSTGQKYFNSLLYKNVEKVISVSKASERDIIKNFPFLSGKTEVIPVGLEKMECIKQVRLRPYHTKHIIHVGGFSFEKNHIGLLRIYEMVRKRIPHSHLHLVGDGPLRKQMEKEVAERNLSPYITFHGFVNNPLSYIKAADILVLPSIIEGLPGVLLEAMYCETPVVAYDVGGIPEIVTIQTGELVPKEEERSFANSVLKLLEHTDQHVLKQANHQVKTLYMNERLALKFSISYSKIMEN